MRSLLFPIATGLVAVVSAALPGPTRSAWAQDCVADVAWVRFDEGVVSFPAETDHGHAYFELPLAEAEVLLPELRALLEYLRIETFQTVAPVWRHLAERDLFDRHGNAIDLVDFTDVYRLTTSSELPIDVVASELSECPGVAYAECIPTLEADFTPNDDDFDKQWHLFGDTCNADYDINAIEAWDIADSAGTKIAILDDGIDKDHEDLEGYVDTLLSKSWVSYNQTLYDWGDYGGHGTPVAGTAAAGGNNSTGVAGVANLTPSHSDSVLVALKFSHNELWWSPADYIDDAVGYLASDIYPKALVANTSWGYPKWQGCHSYGATIRDVFRNAFMKDIVLVASGGNGADCSGETSCGSPDNCMKYPSGFEDYVVAVSAIDCYGDFWRPNSQVTGRHIDVTAPGVDIYTTKSTGGYGYVSGTSFSTPIVAGVAALLIGEEPALLNEDVYQILRMTAEPVPGLDDEEIGAGLVRADSALSLISLPRKVGYGTNYTYSRADSVDARWVELMNVTGVNANEEEWDSVWVHVYEISVDMSLKNPFSVPAIFDAAWARARTAAGWKEIGPALDYKYDAKYHANWAGFKDLDLESGTGTIHTYTYRVFADDTEADTLCWHPIRPSSASDTCPQAGLFSVGHVTVAHADIGPGARGGEGESPLLTVLPMGHGATEGSMVVFSARRAALYSLRVFDVRGRLVRRIIEGVPLESGVHEVSWDHKAGDGRRVASGVYLVQLVETGREALASSRRVVVR